MASRSRPNIIVFFTDQQRFDSTGLHGNPLELTPNFDRLASGGTHLFNTFTPQPVCGPARSCLQTGMYPTATGCFTNAKIPAPGSRLLGHRFAEAGYHTAYIGKWHLANADPVPVDQRGGYQHWLAANLLEFTSDTYRCDLFDADNKPVRLPGYRVDALTDAAIRYINDRATNHPDQPFFLFLSFLEPHHQNHLDDYPPPIGYRERYAGRWTPPDLGALGGSAQQHLGGYWGMVKRLDEALGRLVDALVSLKLFDSTSLLFTSDHGCHFKTRNSEYKRTCHEASVRIPAMFCGHRFQSQGQIPQLISLLDIPPTLLDLAGIPVPEEFHGRSILPLLENRNTPWRDDVYIQISESQVGRVLRTKRWKYAVHAPGANAWTTPHSTSYVEYALYDLQSDPYELSNLVGHESHRAVADRLKERLLARIAANNEPPATIENAPPVPRFQRRVDPDDLP